MNLILLLNVICMIQFSSTSYGNSSLIPVESSCDVYVKLYSKAISNYTSCLVLHSRPFRLCMSCFQQYSTCQHIYDILLKTSTDKKGVSCADLIANDYQVELVMQMHNFVENSWLQNYCFDCYKLKNSSDLSLNAINFLARLETFNQCIFDKTGEHWPYIVPGEITVNKTVCRNCKNSYRNLSDFYLQLDPNFDGHFCMDLSDSMNLTWNLWHESFKCSFYPSQLDISVAIASLLIGLPVLLYLLSTICSTELAKSFLKEKRLWKYVKPPHFSVAS